MNYNGQKKIDDNFLTTKHDAVG